MLNFKEENAPKRQTFRVNKKTYTAIKTNKATPLIFSKDSAAACTQISIHHKLKFKKHIDTLPPAKNFGNATGILKKRKLRFNRRIAAEHSTRDVDGAKSVPAPEATNLPAVISGKYPMLSAPKLHQTKLRFNRRIAAEHSTMDVDGAESVPAPEATNLPAVISGKYPLSSVPNSGHSKLQFENERSSSSFLQFGNQPHRKHRLHFTDKEKAANRAYALPFDVKMPDGSTETAGQPADRDFTPEYVDLSPDKKNDFIRSMSQCGKIFFLQVSNEVSKLADESENDGVRAADRTRLIGGAGASVGWAAGRLHWERRKINEEKHIRKKEGRERIQQEKESLYQMRHEGKEAPSAIKRRKKQIKRKQIRSFFNQRVGEKNVERGVKVARFIGKVVKKLVAVAVTYIGLPLLGILAVFMLLFGMATLLFSVMGGSMVTILSSYTADEGAIEAVSMLASKLEAELEQEIAGVPSAWEWGHIDEFRYDVDPIGHDPFELMAYLSVTNPGFDMGILSPIPKEIKRLHNRRYDLILEQQVETRTRTTTTTDPVTGVETTTEEEYDYYILNIILRSSGIEITVYPELAASPDGELWEWYKVLQETKGARQDFGNPFGEGVDWYGNVTSLYGYRIDPLGGKNLQTHRGLDIAAPEGTPLAAGITGQVQYVGYDKALGNYIVLADTKNRTILYAHCKTILAAQDSAVTAGDIIAEVGNTGSSSGAHVHIEIKRNDKYLDPIYALEGIVQEEVEES